MTELELTATETIRKVRQEEKEVKKNEQDL